MQPIIQICLVLTLIAVTVCIHLATVNVVLRQAALVLRLCASTVVYRPKRHW